jgi:VanZ family protein
MKSGSKTNGGGNSDFISGGEINPGRRVCQTPSADYTAGLRFSDVLKSWLPVLIWTTLMFTASTDLLSTEHTSRFVVPFLRWLKPDISWATIVQVHFLIRKGAHLTEYAILAVLFWRAFRLRRINVRSSLWPQAAIALAVAIILAATDEYHQAYVPSRGASPLDVIIDSCGAIAGIMIRWLVARAKKARATAS